MNIKTDFPFDFCDTCPKLDPDLNRTEIWMGNKKIHYITISCANTELCKYLKENLERTENRKDDTDK